MNQTQFATDKIANEQTKIVTRIVRLWSYLEKPWLFTFLILFFSFSSSIALISGIYLIAVSINNALGSIISSGGYLNWPIFLKDIFLMIGCYLISSLSFLLMTLIVIRTSQNIGFRMRRELFIKLQTLPFKTIDQNQRGDILSRLTNDVSVVTTAMTTSTTIIFNGIIQVLFISIFLFLIAPIIAAVVVVLIPILFYGVTFFLKKSMPYLHKQQHYLGNLNAIAENYYSGHKIIQNFNYINKASNQFDEVSYKNAFFQRKSVMISGSIFPYSNFIAQFLVVIVVFMVAIFTANIAHTNLFYTTLNNLKIDGNLAPKIITGRAAALMSIFIIYLRQTTNPISQILSIVNQIQLLFVGASRVFELTNWESEKQEYLNDEAKIILNDKYQDRLKEFKKLYDSKKISLEDYNYQTNKINALFKENNIPNEEKLSILKVTNGHVKFENIKFSYSEDKVILKNISFEGKPGTMNAIVGPTGSGKTTIINLLDRFYELNSGRILVDDQDISKVLKHSLRENITIVLQESFLFGISIRDNILEGRKDASEDEIINAAKMSNAWSFIKLLPKGLDTIVDYSSGLSEGQKQLIAIARAFLTKARIIILDEATSYVDTKTEKQIQNAMSKLMENRTSFIIAHRLSTIKNADNIIVIENGSLIEQGTHNELINKKGLYAKLNKTCLVEES
ncbi:MAG: ABC transporter ATP-binding protein [Mycoplasmoidaceae bacterium]